MKIVEQPIGETRRPAPDSACTPPAGVRTQLREHVAQRFVVDRARLAETDQLLLQGDLDLVAPAQSGVDDIELVDEVEAREPPDLLDDQLDVVVPPNVRRQGAEAGLARVPASTISSW